MLLYLMRHAIAAERANSDAARELTPEGIAQARSVAEKLRQYSPLMERVISSPYARARQTASHVMPLFPDLELISDESLRPGGDVYSVMEAIEGYDMQQVMLVGHNPFMSVLLSVLVDGTIASHRHVGNAQLYCLSMDVVAPGCGEIRYTLEP